MLQKASKTILTPLDRPVKGGFVRKGQGDEGGGIVQFVLSSFIHKDAVARIQWVKPKIPHTSGKNLKTCTEFGRN